jgi:hypothetical protein
LTSTTEDEHECRWRKEAIDAIAERDRLRIEVENLKRLCVAPATSK